MTYPRHADHQQRRKRPGTGQIAAAESASDFARAAAEARAEEILRRQEATLVPDDFFDALLAELDQPAERNARLSAAAQRARDRLDPA